MYYGRFLSDKCVKLYDKYLERWKLTELEFSLHAFLNKFVYKCSRCGFIYKYKNGQTAALCGECDKMNDITCPSCDTEFEAETWESGKCPTCGKAYYWTEECTVDYSDCWASLEWE